ncbi:MAG TPA: hypothetical protein VHB21_14950 [Minicystis sp.]|nr:hypothetical protein [Minicystis sp.]
MGPSLEIRVLAAVVAVAVALGMCAATAAWLVRLPPDAFRTGEPDGRRVARRLTRSVIGVALVVGGFVLALPGVPGPGVALVILGLLVADLPGKRRAEMHLIRQPSVLAAVNALRSLFDRPPLEPPGPHRPDVQFTRRRAGT